MYLLFRYHHYEPSKIYWMNQGERQIVYSFMRYEMEQREKENTPDEGGV